MVKPYSKGYLARCYKRFLFIDIIHTLLVVFSLIAMFYNKSDLIIIIVAFIALSGFGPLVIQRIPEIFNENMLCQKKDSSMKILKPWSKPTVKEVKIA